MSNNHVSSYHLNQQGEFVIDGYNGAKPFSSFFPGVAGMDGIPMWTFYVNRGQCVCSMGVQDKDHAILEFYPANQAYQMASTMGFRTFLNFPGSDHEFYEPFQNHGHSRLIRNTQQMRISANQLVLEERNETLGLNLTVAYSNVSNDHYAGLIRRLQIRNDTQKSIRIRGLDGIPLVVPYGVDNASLKFTRRLVEAFVEVVNLDKRAPLFRGKVEPVDRPEVVKLRQGNFYLGFDQSGLIAPVVDPVKVFACQTDYSYPQGFLQATDESLLQEQILENRYPCAMGLFDVTIPAGSTYSYSSIIGHSPSVEELNDMVPRIANTEYIEGKLAENVVLMDRLLQSGSIVSGDPVFDQYVRQNYLDNGLRGGFPLTLKGIDGQAMFYLYSRKHGDLERDYNHFSLSPSNYSQGNANYRDVNQNRRNDLLFNPDIGTTNIENFYNLIQLDGYNPLVIKDVYFSLREHDSLPELLRRHVPEETVGSLIDWLQQPFTPGLLMAKLYEEKVSLKGSSEPLVAALLARSERSAKTDHGEGFWTDHWVYNLDLLENYLAVYPEKAAELLFDKKDFSFYDNAHRVRPRNEKYVLWDGNPMQLEAVFFDAEKAELINRRAEKNHLVRVAYGQGEIYQTTLISKMISLIAIKMASLDPAGVGVEMEADKPNWYDALNGLPGVLGSSLNETLEIKRNILFLQTILAQPESQGRFCSVHEELADLIQCLSSLLDQSLSSFEFWERAASAREYYRERTRLGVSGVEVTQSCGELGVFFAACLNKLEQGIQKAWNHDLHIPASYFINSVTEYSLLKNADGSNKLNGKGMPCFEAKAFQQIPLPLFLEGPVHYLKTCQNQDDASTLARNIKNSALYDKKLKMYKVNAPLDDQPMEIGRARVFSPGWFENESIWLHMEYKYMLELLRAGLYDEFYGDFRNVIVPFFNPATYGRSILENSSFIVSSANPDASLHGNGFVARLSGATAEFINMLLLMTVGRAPFGLNEIDQLTVNFKPALPGWLFTENQQSVTLDHKGSEATWQLPENSFSFMFLGSIFVTYINSQRKDTFGPAAVVPQKWELENHSGEKVVYSTSDLYGPVAESIRQRQVRRMVITLAEPQEVI